MSETKIDTSRYAMLEDDWIVKDGTFTSPALTESTTYTGIQTLIFDQRLKNGFISADITLLESEVESSKIKNHTMEAALVIRHREDGSCIYAGTGGFGAKFFIGKIAADNAGWQSRAEIGQRSSIKFNRTFQLRIEFNGSRIALFENDVQQRMIIDENYLPGQCGLRTWKTQARFTNVVIRKKPPRAFVIMPFKPELDYVHKVIEETVSQYGIDCERADQLAVSRPVMDDIDEKIAEADLIIVDFTGNNPNVYFEAGMAHAWKKDWIVLTQTTDDLTFDVRHIRCIKYSNTMRADEKLKHDLENAIEALQYQRIPEDPSK